MAPVPTEGTSTASPMSHQSIPKNTAEMFPVTVVPSDQNDNYVAVNGEDLFTLRLSTEDFTQVSINNFLS